MIWTNFNKALLVTCFITGATVSHAQGTMPKSSPTDSDIATTPSPNPNQTPTQQLTDSQITTVLMATNNAEIRQGKMTQKNVKNKDLVQFAKQMVTEHTASLNLLLMKSQQAAST